MKMGLLKKVNITEEISGQTFECQSVLGNGVLLTLQPGEIDLVEREADKATNI
jgi:hypothetical protein